VFCKGTPVTGEHAWPAWIGEAFRANNPNTKAFGYKHTGRKALHMKRLDIRVKRICKVCNGGWMSDLESRAAPLLTTMIFQPGQTIDIGMTEQALIAQWAYKMALMLDFTNPRRTIPDALYSAFHESQHKVPETASVWTAAYDWDWRIANYWQLDSHLRKTPAGVDPKGAPAEMSMFKTTIAVGCALFQIIDRIGGQQRVEFRDSAYAPLFLRLIPLDRDTVRWPPSGRIIPTDHWDAIKNEQTWFALPPDPPG
jgi:hypothetical protein